MWPRDRPGMDRAGSRIRVTWIQVPMELLDNLAQSPFLGHRAQLFNRCDRYLKTSVRLD